MSAFDFAILMALTRTGNRTCIVHCWEEHRRLRHSQATLPWVLPAHCSLHQIFPTIRSQYPSSSNRSVIITQSNPPGIPPGQEPPIQRAALYSRDWIVLLFAWFRRYKHARSSITTVRMTKTSSSLPIAGGGAGASTSSG